MAAQTAIPVAPPVHEYLMVTPRRRGELPYFLRNPLTRSHDGEEWVCGQLVDARATTLNARFEIKRKEIRKVCRAIQHPNGALVPVG